VKWVFLILGITFGFFAAVLTSMIWYVQMRGE
jgi:hypothetical protein